MKVLGTVPPTPEQLTIVQDGRPGYWLIRGAAGSGKTTTALLRLKFLVTYWRERRLDLDLDAPVRVLVLTFNRTLRGYIQALAQQQISEDADVELEIATFGSWAQRLLGRTVLEHQPRQAQLKKLAAGKFDAWGERFLNAEVEYVLGRFPHAALAGYCSAARTGRGATPQVQRPARERLLAEVIEPYQAWKADQDVADWQDLAADLAVNQVGSPYDVVVVDEAQDFSANQVRSVARHLADDFVCTFIRDTTQRIYPGYFTWSEIGVAIPQAQNKKLTVNYRNTRQIAAFARPLVEGIETVEDGTIPDFRGCVREGPEPFVLRGGYFLQVDWAIDYLRSGRIGGDETVAFLHPLGWFRDLRQRLEQEDIPYTSLTREVEWPGGPEQIALSTMHSAKGLEFDHVLLIGYNAEVVPHGEEPGDSLMETHRRLLAMAVGRARRSVVLGYKPEDTSALIDFLDPQTFERVNL